MIFLGEKLLQCRVWQVKKPKGKYRKGRHTKKDCRITENMNTHFRYLCDCYKEVAKALAQSPSPIYLF